MTDAHPGSRWWAGWRGRLAGGAVVAAASSPGTGRLRWAAGALAGSDVTPTTTFYAASVTKQLVGVLVARSVLDGRLRTSDSIREHLPVLPTWTAPIRVHHLLHHTAALPTPRRLAAALGHADDDAGVGQLDDEAVLAALHRVRPPARAPGRCHVYDNTGYVLLAALLRALHGRDLDDLAREELFTPLGMSGSRIGGPASVTLPGQPAPPRTTGDGGLWTCAADLLTWLEALDHNLLGADLTTLVQSPGRLDDGTVLDYAWGAGPRPGPAGTVYLHGGGWPGWGAMTVRCPATATAVVVLAATEDALAVSAAALELHGLLSGAPGDPRPR